MVTNNFLLLMNNTSIMSDHFTFLYFKKKFKITKLCRPEGEKG